MRKRGPATENRVSHALPAAPYTRSRGRNNMNARLSATITGAWSITLPLVWPARPAAQGAFVSPPSGVLR
jgi:hypothetical protein